MWVVEVFSRKTGARLSYYNSLRPNMGFLNRLEECAIASRMCPIRLTPALILHDTEGIKFRACATGRMEVVK